MEKKTLDGMLEEQLKKKPEYVQKRYKYVLGETDKSLAEVDSNTTLGIIVDATYGVVEGQVMLMLNIMLNESLGTTTYMGVDEASEFIRDYNIRDIRELVGKSITVFKTFNRILWLEPCKIKLRKRT